MAIHTVYSGYLLFFETTIMGKTADLAMIQKTIIDTLQKEGKCLSILRFCTRTLAYAYSRTRSLTKYTPFEVVRERGRLTHAH